MDQNKSNKTIIVALIILIISMTFIFIMDKTKQTDTSEETNADKLYAHKSEYIGDSSNISGLDKIRLAKLIIVFSPPDSLVGIR